MKYQNMLRKYLLMQWGGELAANAISINNYFYNFRLCHSSSTWQL
jgi:hypothetical protein